MFGGSKLPGVGVLHTFVTDDGGKVGVIAHRSGHSDLITFADDEDGADASKVSLRLSEDEAHTLAELLGGTQITESLTALDQIPGLSASTGSASTTKTTSPASRSATRPTAASSG